MNATQLKLLACVFMISDHVGKVFFPETIIWQALGRLSFPIFAFFIAEGYRKSKDLTDYIGRTVLLALLSQGPYSSIFSTTRVISYNVIFIYVLALISLHFYEENKLFWQVVVIALISEFLHMDYGAYGILVVIIFYLYGNDYLKLFKLLTFATFALSGKLLYYGQFWPAVIQPLSILSLLLLKKYNGQRGCGLKCFFYGFYPLHIMLITLVLKYLY